MVLEAALLLGYQTQQGVLFQDLGLLLTVFMAGLSLGAAYVNRTARRRAGQGSGMLGAGLVGGMAGLSGLTALSIGSRAGGSLLVTCALLLGAGTLVGAVFAYASRQRSQEQEAAVAPLYAADLIGGCAGSLAGSLLLVPILGLPGSAWGAGAASLVGLLLL